MTVEDLVSQGWADHANDAQGVFGRLSDGVGLVTDRKQIPMFASLAVHVSGEHLGRWKEGVSLLERLERSPGFDAASPEGKSLARSKAILHYAAGDRAAAERCLKAGFSGGAVPEGSDRARVLATAASALAGQKKTTEARAAFEEALRQAAYGPKADDPAAKALAITGNNLSVALENRPSRTPEEDALMVRAAEAGLQFWEIAGGWTEAERAHYRLSHSLRKAGKAREALDHAKTCLAIVERNGSDACESFFAHEALGHARLSCGDPVSARAARDAAAALLPRIEDADLRSAASSDLAALDAALAP